MNIVVLTKSNYPKDADGIASSVDLDEAAPWSTLFAQTCLCVKLRTISVVELIINIKVTVKDFIFSWSSIKYYCRNPKNSDTQTIAVSILKLEQNRFTTDELAQKM